jgi:hypothetical protein
VARKLIDPVEIGAMGGKARAVKLSDRELSEGSSFAANARWDAYYEAHPEKLKARKEREAGKKRRNKHGEQTGNSR